MLDLFKVIKCESDIADDGSAVKETLYDATILAVIVCIIELILRVFTSPKLAVDVTMYDFSTLVDGNSLAEDTLASFVVNGSNRLVLVRNTTLNVVNTLEVSVLISEIFLDAAVCIGDVEYDVEYFGVPLEMFAATTEFECDE